MTYALLNLVFLLPPGVLAVVAALRVHRMASAGRTVKAGTAPARSGFPAAAARAAAASDGASRAGAARDSRAARNARAAPAAVGAAAVVLLVLTAIFDNVMIAAGLFSFNPDTILGLFLGLVPLEDFAYPAAAVLMLPALWILLVWRKEPRGTSD
ncbi:MAG: lycopene cyclase [Micrococcaceae bacterium]|nr:lycopene cyclase [Micrococcaceae bacterium]